MGTQENFSESQQKLLKRFVSNITGKVFVLTNLPEVIKGALFSRYSRSSLGLRSLLLKEFLCNDEAKLQSLLEDANQDNSYIAVQKAQQFYDRILDGFGDDSIGELGGAHLALENISMLAAKAIEDCRIGGSPLEKSTRYIYFDTKVDGEYLFYKEPIIMASAYKELYLKTCNRLFDTYSSLIAPLTTIMESKFPQDPQVPKAAYTAAIRAKVLDCLRGLLPASALTNVGLFGNGRFFESMIKKLSTHNLKEMQELGSEIFTELATVIPSFIRRSHPSHKNQIDYLAFSEKTKKALNEVGKKYTLNGTEENAAGVRLIHYNKESLQKVAAALLYENSNASLQDLEKMCKNLSHDELDQIFDAACQYRQSRRHKSPRALENVEFTFEIVADFGIYRDLQRHRILTQQRQLLGCNLGYYIPQEIANTEMEKDYVEALEAARQAYDTIAQELPEEAQYIVPMAYHLRWYFHVNLRSLQWICELRSSQAGHPNYRKVAWEMATQIFKVFPLFKKFFSFMDFHGSELGRMGQEIRRVEKQNIR